MKKLFLKTFFISAFFFLFLLVFSFLNSNKVYAATCGQIGGNSCTTRWSDNCDNLGNTDDCSPCWRCHAPGGQPPAPAAPPSRGPDCGSIGGNACSWAAPNAQPPNTCTSLGNTYDCSPCLVCSAPAPTAAPKDCGSIGGNACSWAAPNAQPPNTCTSLGNTYDCSPCLVCSAPKDCGSIGGTDCTTASPRLHDGQTWYCHSLGNTYDCSPCLRCSTNTSVCSSPPPPPPCSCSTSYGACNQGCPVGQKKKIVTCNRSGCGEGTSCVTDPACNPSCTMSLSPSSLSIQAGESTILTANVSVQNGSISRVNFSSGNSTVASPNPSSVSSSPYRTQVTGNNVGSTTITAQAILNPSGSCLTSAPVSVEAQAWFQTQGGDVHAQGSLSDKIPSTATNRNLSLDLNNYPGIISHKPDSQVSFGEGYPSKSITGNWLAPSEYQGKPYGSFDFFKKKYALKMTSDNFSGALPAEDGVYYSADSEILNSYQGDWDLSGNRWLVILVEGDVTIPFNVIVNEGSFLAIASSGNITFGSNVRKAQGMFVANGTIDTGSGDKDFAGQGIFAASGFGLNRDFGDARNRTTPAETFVARPDFLMSSYKDAERNVWWFSQIWKELAP